MNAKTRTITLSEEDADYIWDLVCREKERYIGMIEELEKDNTPRAALRMGKKHIARLKALAKQIKKG